MSQNRYAINNRPVVLSLIVPCYNEEQTLAACIERVLEIGDAELKLEVIIVDDCSQDDSLEIARRLAAAHPTIKVFTHPCNRGKGAALRTGFTKATGDFVAIQDADLEYDPADLKKLLRPLREGRADVVLGSRFLTTEVHRVFHFWHALGNRFLTLLSNMFTDLNLTDMETCYKVFRREIIQGLDLREDRFGFEPEVIAKLSRKRLRIYEMGISYFGRSYDEGKKIGFRDGLRALYCILKYNLHQAPPAIQFCFYTLIAGSAALANLLLFLLFLKLGWGPDRAAPAAFLLAAAINYWLCIKLIFRHRARWNSAGELFAYGLVVAGVCLYDWGVTRLLLARGLGPTAAKLTATATGLVLNFLGRRYVVFPEKGNRTNGRTI